MEQWRKDARSEVLIVDIEAFEKSKELWITNGSTSDWIRITATIMDAPEPILLC